MSAAIEAFRQLHIPGDPLILVNIWDAGSAAAVASAGARAIATGSYGVAGALGTGDGEALALDDALANLRRIIAITDLPVSIDMESGYGITPAEVAVSVAAARTAGAAGINMEDRMPGEQQLLPIALAAERYRAAADSGLFINARCDMFRGRDAADDGDALVTATVERARAYADAGASGLFVPFLADARLIGAICAASPLPVNILHSADAPTHHMLAELGVARISHGHLPWAAAMAWLHDQAQQVFRGDQPDY